MKAVFFFDYSDYRSYLMMHALDRIEGVALDVQWRSVDAYSLRAMSGCTPSAHTPMERAYERQEAERFCRANEIDFAWHAEPILSGMALSAGIWFMTHAPEVFEAYARRVLNAVWAHGRLPDAALIRSVFEALDVDSDPFFSDMNERESFHVQDAFLQDALSAGVFDVPAVVIGKAVFMRYVQANEMRLEGIAQWLLTLPREVVAFEAARLLSQLPNEAFAKTAARLQTGSGSERRSPPRSASVRTNGFVAIDLPRPKTTPSRKCSDIETPVACQTITAQRPRSLASALAHSRPGVVNICTTPNLECLEDELVNVDFDVAGERLFLAYVKRSKLRDELQSLESAIVCVRVDAFGACRVVFCDDDSSPSCTFETLSDAMLAILTPNASRDLSMARFAYGEGAHIVCRCEAASSVPIAEAFGCIASAWVFEFSETGVCLVDSYAHRKKLADDDAFVLDKSRMIDAGCWQAAAPRTLLLLEKAVSFGDIDTHADIELACRGRDLAIVTANQESNISHARDYIVTRAADTAFDIIPMSGDAIYAYETSLYRTLCTVNRAPKRSYPICVNYWADLEYEMLDVIRPIHATMAATLRIPILFVVGSQLVEIWLCSSSGTPYRIEKDGDAFHIDFADLTLNSNLLSTILKTLDISAQTLVQRMAGCESS